MMVSGVVLFCVAIGGVITLGMRALGRPSAPPKSAAMASSRPPPPPPTTGPVAATASSTEPAMGPDEPATRPGEPQPATPPAAAPVTVASSVVPDRPEPLPQLPPLSPPASQAAPPGRPLARPIPNASTELSDEQIGQSIQRGVNFLVKEFDPATGQLRGDAAAGRGRRGGDPFHDGADILCVYALMQCDQAINDPRLSIKGSFMVSLIEAMKNYSLDNHFGTYSHGLRATALALNNRREDSAVLHGDVDLLVKGQDHGAYTYALAPGRRGDNWDNSNSQYGLLGAWSGAEAGVEVPLVYWQEIEKHWRTTQLVNGQWAYHQDDDGRLTMTCAGIASMFVCHDYLDAPKFGAAVGREPFSPQLKKGLAWLERGNNAMHVRESEWWGYALYGVERVGLASGFKFFGAHNWYPELARVVIARQQADGSFGERGDVVNTAYALLFLSRGRHPILMNKLRFDGYWANRPRDVSNLAKYASAQLEHPLNWQVVSTTNDWTDWTDSPILYLASHKPFALSDAETQKIRNYVLAGGMLFMQADGDAPAMLPFARDLAHRLFPAYEMTDVPPKHPLFNSVYKLPTHPQLKMVSNGSRILMLFSPSDLSRRWQLREQRGAGGKPIFDLGINLFIYSAGRRDLRNRLATNALAPVQSTPTLTVNLARIKYAGNWDPEPFAWTRFANWFARQSGYRLVVQTVGASDLDPRQFPIASLTGTSRWNATDAEVAGLKKYVESGGLLLIDNTGGGGEFDDAVRTTLIAKAFPSVNPQPVRSFHPLLCAGPSGMYPLGNPRLRAYAHERLGTSAQIDLYAFGKGHVLFTPLDITSGLLNTDTWGILGFEPLYSQQLVSNAILWSLDGQKDGK